MQAADVGHAIERLRELANKGPGAQPEALKEAQAILFRLGVDGDPSGYLSEKLTATRSSFEAWLGENQRGSDGGDRQAFGRTLTQDIERLRKALARGSAGQD
jgi:hypothetical protein